MSRPIGPHQHPDRPRARLVALLAISLALLLSACGTASNDVPEDRKFANEPVTEQVVTATETSEVDVDATPIVVETVESASPETLLSARGTPNTLYTFTNGALDAISLQDGGSKATRIALPANQRVVDFDGSPSGDRVAVLMAADDDGALWVGFFRASGEALGPMRSLPNSGVLATPETEVDGPSYTVSWSPQGTDVLIVGPALLETVKVEGEPRPVPVGEIEGQLIDAAWSPQGSRIFLHVAADDGSQHVYVRDIAAEKTREVRVLATAPGHGVSDLQWLPDGSGMVYVQGRVTDGVVVRGQLYVYVLGQETPRLIATSGQGGPSATVTEAVVSPDGRSVAYVISLLDGADWAFHSMWVRSLDGSLSYQVPVSSRGVVAELAWAGRGLVWEQRPAPDMAGEIMLLRKGQEPIVVFKAPSVDSSATPGASPADRGGATPVGSLRATPVGTPGATPD